jgi:hypothetical protein
MKRAQRSPCPSPAKRRHVTSGPSHLLNDFREVYVRREVGVSVAVQDPEEPVSHRDDVSLFTVLRYYQNNLSLQLVQKLCDGDLALRMMIADQEEYIARLEIQVKVCSSFIYSCYNYDVKITGLV